MKSASHHLSRNLRILRKARRLSQIALAERSGVSRPAIANIECGVCTTPTVRTLNRLGAALNVPVWVLLEPSLCRQDAA
jgi:transcriptional regulator with XRE-family HTH domain